MRGNQFLRVGLLAGIAAVTALTGCVQANPTRVRAVAPLESMCDSTEVPSHIEVNGRFARLVAPPDAIDGTPKPLLVSLHPFLLGADAWEDYSKLAATAAERGMWALIPEGLEAGPRWSVPGGVASDTDDVAFIDALIEQTARTVCVDANRVYAAGFSAGAALAVGLSCELPGRFAAIAASGGSNLTSLCPTSAPTAALLMHGTADSIVPLAGQEVAFVPPTGIHLDDVARSFAQRNACGARPAPTTPLPTMSVTTYVCAAAPLVDIRVAGMGHVWAGGNGIVSWIAPPVDPAIVANDIVLNFFAAE